MAQLANEMVYTCSLEMNDDTPHRERLIELFTEIDQLTNGAVSVSVVQPADGYVNRSQLETFAIASGFTKQAAASLWSRLLNDRSDTGHHPNDYHGQTLTIRHVRSSMLRHQHLEGLSENKAFDCERDLDAWVIPGGQIAEKSEAIIHSGQRQFGEISTKLLRLWAASLSNTKL